MRKRIRVEALERVLNGGHFSAAVGEHGKVVHVTAALFRQHAATRVDIHDHGVVQGRSSDEHDLNFVVDMVVAYAKAHAEQVLEDDVD